MTQDELDQTLEQFKEQFGDKPRYILLSFSENRTVVLNGIFGNIYECFLYIVCSYFHCSDTCYSIVEIMLIFLTG